MSRDTGPDPAGDVEVVWIDDRLAVVEKPAGVVVHDAPSHHEPTLVEMLDGIAGGGESGRRGIVHRLDRDTSGLLLVGRDDEAVDRLQDMIRKREVRRRYLALVEARPRSRTGRIEAAIGRSLRDRSRMAVDGAAAREAVTEFEVIEPLGATSLVEARLVTGRTHQIRVHMQAIGNPIAGDPVYGGRPRAGLTRQFLHAHALEFSHPFTGVEISLRSPLPPDLESALELARRE